jgi:hypothetical protein
MPMTMSSPESQPDDFCSERCRQVGEPLWGTASRVDTWLALEYTGPWGRKAFEESDLSQPVKERLTEYLNTLPNSRLEFIKQQEPSTGIAFFVAVAHAAKPVLYAFQLTTYEDLLTLDLPAVVAGDAAYDAFLRDAPLFLVCTNGRRDRCCARNGFPVYQKMAQRAGRDAWQCTHLGGHRFAATAAFLPQGICYGRIDPSDAMTLVDAHEEGRIYLSHYRGRSCYDPFVQAADYLLRARTGITGLSHFRLQETQVLGEDRWAVSFAAPDGTVHTLRIAREATGLLRNASCTADQPTEVTRYRLIDADGYPDA